MENMFSILTATVTGVIVKKRMLRNCFFITTTQVCDCKNGDGIAGGSFEKLLFNCLSHICFFSPIQSLKIVFINLFAFVLLCK